MGIAGLFVERGVEHEALALAQLDLALGKAGDADFRALQVGEDGDEAAMFARHLADQFGAGHVLRGRAVGEVQAHHVHAGADQAFDGGG
ncbi:hypothetical protein D3C80_1218120 [compost metagenome]